MNPTRDTPVLGTLISWAPPTPLGCKGIRTQAASWVGSRRVLNPAAHRGGLAGGWEHRAGCHHTSLLMPALTQPRDLLGTLVGA